MFYFGHPLGIRGWKLKPETKPDKFRVSEPENRGQKIKFEPESTRPEIRGAPTRNHTIATLMGNTKL
jgi:hypothetical protein